MHVPAARAGPQRKTSNPAGVIPEIHHKKMDTDGENFQYFAINKWLVGGPLCILRYI